MVFKRVFMPMFVMGIILAMGSMAYAQIPAIDCTIASVAPAGVLPSLPGPTARATATGHTEPIGAGPDGTAITFVAGTSGAFGSVPGGGALRVICKNNSGAIVGPATAAPGYQFTTLVIGQISFGVPITNSTAFPVLNTTAIRLINPTGAFAGAGGVSNATASLTIAGTNPVNNSAGTVSFQIANAAGPATGAATWDVGASGSFDIDGVLVSLNGTGKTSVIASLFIGGATGYETTCLSIGDTGTCNSATVISNVLAGLDPAKITNPSTVPVTVAPAGVGGTAAFNLLGLGIKPTFAIRVEENYLDMFKSSTQFNGGGAGVFPISGASNTEVQFQFSGIPAGLIIGGCSVALTDASAAAPLSATATALVSAASVTATAPTLTVNFSGTVNQTGIDVLWLVCTTLTDTTDTSLPAVPVTVQVSLAPGGAALGTGGTVLTSALTGQIPRYQLTLLPAAGIPIVNFPPGAVSLLIPFGTIGGGYDTGIAISNTTSDPFGSAGSSSVTPQNGTLTFTTYDNSGTVKSYTTSASSPGSGLAGGILNSGHTYAVNLSDILKAAGYTAPVSFSGYVFITTNFTNAHGAAYIYNGAGFTSSTPVLVVTSRVTPESLNN